MRLRVDVAAGDKVTFTMTYYGPNYVMPEATITIGPAFLMGWDIQRLFGRSVQEVAQVTSTVAPNPAAPDEEEEDDEKAPLVVRVTATQPGDSVRFVVLDMDRVAPDAVLEIDRGPGAVAPYVGEGNPAEPVCPPPSICPAAPPFCAAPTRWPEPTACA